MTVDSQKKIVNQLDNKNKFYSAILQNLTQEEKDLSKSKTCLLGISVGNEYHEGEKFRATLYSVNAYFKKCTIAVGDTLQRHTMAISYENGKQAHELYDLSKKLGDEWIARNEQIIKEELKIPYEIIRWDHWINNEKFARDIKMLRDGYASNEQYRVDVDYTINEFMERYKNSKQIIDETKVVKNSLEYLLEECACMLQWFDDNHGYFVYPQGKNKAMESASRLFEPVRNDFLLKSLGISFKGRKSPKVAYNLNQVTLNAIIQTLPGHVYWKNTHGVLLGCNLKQAKSIGAKDVESVLGKSDFELLEPDDAMNLRLHDLEVMRSKKTHIVEEFVEFYGKESTFLSYKTPLKDDEGNVVGIVGVSLDITKQKEAEKKLAEKNQQLIKAIEAKRSFLNNVSHEIRTPLSNLLKMSHLLYDDWDNYPDNEARKAHLKIAIEGSERLQEVLLNLLDLSHVEAGKIVYNKKLYCLKQSVIDVMNEFADQKYRIHTSFESGVNFNLVYDHFRIEQVIRNLMANALTYGGSNEIKITLSEQDGFIVFVVTDRGVGIPEDELDEIFKIFTQSTRTSGAGGTGIGLSVSKSIIEDHGGFIWAKNNKDGIGCHFLFKLPINTFDELEDIETKLSSSVTQLPKTAKDKPNLLVIDDDIGILNVSELIFSKIGFNVITENSGIAGLSRLEKDFEKIDVVLLDMMMPGLRGIEVLRSIKSNSKTSHIPVYIYSGISSKEEIEEIVQNGALGFIDKTSSSDEIAKILAKFLHN